MVDFGAMLQANLEYLFIGVGVVVLFYVFVYPFLKFGYAYLSEVG